MDDNFEFELVGVDKIPFKGYVSSKDPTTADPGIYIRGSKNVYKKINGNVANRPGLKVRGVTDGTQAGTVANFDWYTSLDTVRPMRVNNNKLQVEWTGLGSPVWYDLLLTGTLLSPAALLTRFIFDPWYDFDAAKDILIMANGSPNFMHWGGGIAEVASATANTLTKSDSSKTWGQEGFSADLSDLITGVTIAGSGSGYSVGDILTIIYNPSSDKPGVGGTVTVTSVNSSGAILSINLTTSGANYGLGSALATTGGNGTLATININSVARAEMKFILNGVEYTYNGGVGTQILTGISPNLPAISLGAVAIQSVINDVGPAPLTFNIDFIQTIGNRIHLGSYASRLVYISSFQYYAYFVVPTPRVAGDPELLTLDDTCNGIGQRQGNAWISGGLADWYAVIYTNLTVGTTATQKTDVIKYPGAILSAAYSQEFIDSSTDNILFLAKDQQLRIVATTKDILGESKYPSLSLSVSTEFSNENFTGGAIKIINDDNGTTTYLTAPASGRDWMYTEREVLNEAGSLTSEKLWHSPMIRGISRYSVIDGFIYGHSNTNPMIYKVWDTNQWHDDSPSGSVPYTSVFRLAYFNAGRRQGLWQFNRLYTEGYMARGTNLYSNIYYDYQGSTDIQSVTINETDDGAHFFISSVDISLGDGDPTINPLGDGLVPDPFDQYLIPKWRRINPLTMHNNNSFEYSLEFFSVDLDARWEFIAAGVNLRRAEQDPIFLQKPVV